MSETPKISSVPNGTGADLHYVQDMVGQLRLLVPGDRFKDLRYLLDMARLEAGREQREAAMKERSARE